MKGFAVISLILVLLGLVVFQVYAAPPLPGFSDTDLKAIAEQIVSGTMSEEEFKSLSLSEEEMWTVMRWVLIDQGYSPEKADRAIEHLRNERAAALRGEGVVPLKGPCTQMVELQSGGNQVGCRAVYEYPGCDSDPSDLDYNFEFKMLWYGDPDLIRWWTDDWWIRHVFCWVYGCNLLGHALCISPKFLCIGEYGVTLAGGPTRVKNNLRLRHN